MTNVIELLPFSNQIIAADSHQQIAWQIPGQGLNNQNSNLNRTDKESIEPFILHQRELLLLLKEPYPFITEGKITEKKITEDKRQKKKKTEDKSFFKGITNKYFQFLKHCKKGKHII